MQVLVTGATGLIGSAVVARLYHEGHQPVACVRTPARVPAAAKVAVVDFMTATEDDWIQHLRDVDAVVNCVGVLQDSARDSVAAVHTEGPSRLFAACEKAGVRRVIHFSAIGVDRQTPSSFSRTKLAGDADLATRDLDWVILRPSVVVGQAAYGGSALFRGLAALPILPVMPSTGLLQIVQLDQVIDTVLFFLRPNAPARLAVEIAGPDRLSFTDTVRAFRGWLGGAPQRIVALPDLLSALTYRAGDFAGWLGWRPPIRSTAQAEITRGATGDHRPWSKLTGITPVSLADALKATPASVQEHWFANLYLLKPLVFGVLSLFWIGTGLIALGPGWEVGMGYLRAGGAGDVGPAAIIAGSLADIAIGVGIAFRRTARLALYAAIAISLAYALIGTALVPQLWADPLGPMLKIWPIIVLIMVALAIRGDR